jgi:hypothetical protein
LDGVIRQVDKFILAVVELKLKATRSNIAFLIPVTLDFVVEPNQEHVASDVEFASIVQKGPVNIFLDDKCLLIGRIRRLVLNQ